MIFEIKSRINGSVLFALETESLKLCLEAAIKANANLSSAYLSCADLRNADLRGADLRGAILSYADLRGANLSYANLDKKYIQVACIGSRKGMTTYCVEDDTIWCGCWTGTMSEFKSRVKATHKDNPQYLMEYNAAIKFFETVAKRRRKGEARWVT